MDEGDDAYDILGVLQDATPSEIKTAYRKLALKHHPDKQQTDEDRATAHVLFAKIANAYEILSDETKRQDYDYERTEASRPRPKGRAPAPTDFHHDFFHDHFRFHDPFQVFEQVFREEFGGRGGRSPFDDPFFGGAGGGLFGGRPPFSMMGGGGTMFNDPFFGGAGGDPFSRMQQTMMSSRPTGMSTFISSSSMSGGMPGASSVSKSTTTRIVNGRAETVTETVICKPDGTVERKVEAHGSSNGHQEAPQRLGYEESPEPRRQMLGSTRDRPGSKQQPLDLSEESPQRKRAKRRSISKAER